MSQYADIIERLEKATGPDRELDCRISAAIEPWRFDSPGFTPKRPIPAFAYEAGENIIRFNGGGIMDVRFFPDITYSLDAAIALVRRKLPDAYRESSGPRKYLNIPTPVPAKFRAEILANRGGFIGWHDREPIALLIAMFRALEAEAKP